MIWCGWVRWSPQLLVGGRRYNGDAVLLRGSARTRPFLAIFILYDANLGNSLNYFDGKYVQIINLKAPEKYSALFLSNKISILLCGGPKPNIP